MLLSGSPFADVIANGDIFWMANFQLGEFEPSLFGDTFVSVGVVCSFSAVALLTL